MKKALFLLAVGLCIVAVAFAAPNFSGTWTLNTSKSDMGQGGSGGERSSGGAASTAKSGERSGAPSGERSGGGTSTAKSGERSGAQSASGERSGSPSGGGMSNEMTIKMTGNEMIVTQGTQETKYILDGKDQTVTSGRGELKYKATWAGNVLTIAGTRGDSPYKLTYEMSADGKILTRTSVSGENTRKMVYDKK
jgi:hypothetical protein